MEFKVIVDAKARAAAGCAVVGVYDKGELGAATRPLDAQLGGLLSRAISRPSSARRCCCPIRKAPPRSACC